MSTLWPDIEAAAVQYLAAQFSAASVPALPDLASVHIGAVKLPDIDRQVIVRDDGGSPLEGGRATVRLGFRVFAETDAIAERLAAAVTALLNGWADGRPMLTCTATRAWPVPDAQTPLRYLTAEGIILGPTI